MKRSRSRGNGSGRKLWWVAGIIMAELTAGSQSPSPKLVDVASPEFEKLLETTHLPVPVGILREVHDAGTGRRWLVVRDGLNPAGPGHMVQVPSGDSPAASKAVSTRVGNHDPRSALMIHAGDKLILEEHSPMVHARLEAVALGSAGAGGALDVRLAIGGHAVHAMCVAPGRAVLRSTREVTP